MVTKKIGQTGRRQPGRPPAAALSEARTALLEAASRLFAAHGADAVSLRRVAEEAGVTPAMVHYYFGGKEGLYDALLERAFARVLDRVRAVIDVAPDEKADASDASDPSEPSERLAALLEVLVGTFAAEPWIPTLVVREVLSEGGRFRDRFIADYASHMAELLPGLIRTEVARGRFRADLDPSLAFLSLMGMTIMPFVARPVIERVLGTEYDRPFLQAFAEHTRRLFLEGAGS